MKTRTVIKLVAVDGNNKPVTRSNCQYEIAFVADGYRVFSNYTDQTVTLITPKDTYSVPKHPTLNMYADTLNGIKVHITLKKLVGQIIYWS